MIIINQFQTRSEEKQLEEYVKQRLGKSSSGAPLVRTPVLFEDVKEISDSQELLPNGAESSV